jgi:hypothetical protein
MVYIVKRILRVFATFKSLTLWMESKYGCVGIATIKCQTRYRKYRAVTKTNLGGEIVFGICTYCIEVRNQDVR